MPNEDYCINTPCRIHITTMIYSVKLLLIPIHCYKLNISGLIFYNKGQELVPKYVELTLKSGRAGAKGYINVMKLVKWKDTRELFWSDDRTSSIDTSLVFEDSLVVISEANELNELSEDTISNVENMTPESKVINQVNMA